MHMQVHHPVQGEKGLTQRLAVLREIWEGFPEEAASELRSEGSQVPFQGNKLTGAREAGGHSNRKYSYKTARGESNIGTLRQQQAVRMAAVLDAQG